MHNRHCWNIALVWFIVFFFFFKYVFASIFYFLADLFLFSSNIFVWLLFTYTIKIWARLFKTNDIVS